MLEPGVSIMSSGLIGIPVYWYKDDRSKSMASKVPLTRANVISVRSDTGGSKGGEQL